MKLTEIIAAFNENLSKEYGAILLYIDFRRQPLIAKDEKMASLISDLAEDEMHHAEMLADRIAQLGGQSTWEITPFERKATVEESLFQIVESEKKAIRDYINLTRKLTGQPLLQEMLAAIINDEKRHKEKTEDLLKSETGRKAL